MAVMDYTNQLAIRDRLTRYYIHALRLDEVFHIQIEIIPERSSGLDDLQPFAESTWHFFKVFKLPQLSRTVDLQLLFACLKSLVSDRRLARNPTARSLASRKWKLNSP